jgi:hypothetical protein
MQLIYLPVLRTADFEAIKLGLEVSHSTKPFDVFLEELYNNLYQVWRLRGADTEILIITSINDEKHWKELWLFLIVGRGWIGHLKEIEKELHEIARLKGCKYLSGLATSPGLERAYTHFGAKKVGTVFQKEVF